MARYELKFYKGKESIFSRSICFMTRSDYSHVEIYDIYSGTSYGVLVDEGVFYKHREYKPEHWDTIGVPSMFNINIKNFINHRLQILIERKPRYDYLGVLFTQLLNFRRHAEHKYFCSEFVAEALDIPNPHKYSPAMLKDLIDYIERLT